MAESNRWTAEDVARVNARRQKPIITLPVGATAEGKVYTVTPKPKRSKFGAVKTTVDGIRFDSKREAERFVELRTLLKAGAIRNLVVQPAFQLLTARPDGVLVQSGRYRADFRYEGHEEPDSPYLVYEDVKGPRPTDSYRLRKRMVEAQFGIVITEVR